jgi:hypothetical protein
MLDDMVIGGHSRRADDETRPTTSSCSDDPLAFAEPLEEGYGIVRRHFRHPKVRCDHHSLDLDGDDSRLYALDDVGEGRGPTETDPSGASAALASRTGA